jgi:hypothetical protein
MAYLLDSGAAAAPDDEASGDDSVLDFLAFFAFLCFLAFLAFGCVSVPVALAPASVPDAPDVADGLLVLEPAPLPMVSVELLPLAPGVMPVVSLGDDAPDALLPVVPDAPEASLAALGLLPDALLAPGVVSAAPDALLPVVPDAPDAPDVPLLMPDDEVPLAPDEGDDGDDDMEPVLSFELEEEEGTADLLPLLVSVPVDCASATDDTDATSTNDND